ncbi:hypothetical protein G6731_08480 [Polynucleobacter paneuropaeus]|uniref:Uncharacterized protein n=1 Tax=Polynucleobacter paneuropaeus TaxID=2527775 RepID=A0A9Q2WKP5_9BURK|nr:hypothetical protein [Polynucleobacter paneuropaeus]
MEIFQKSEEKRLSSLNSSHKNMSKLILIAKNLLRPYKRKFKSFLRRMKVAPPVIQLFLGGEYETRFTLVNFPSLYSPIPGSPCFYDVGFYDPDGTCLGKKSIEINSYGSYELLPSEFIGSHLPDYGIFTAKIRLKNIFIYRHLGKIRSHIYALFSDRAQTSFALVHPQTFINQPSDKNYQWLSAISIDARKVQKIIAFQPNPTSKCFKAKYYLLWDNSEKKIFAQIDVCIPPMGTKKIDWNLSALGISDGYISVGASCLPTGNGKPILFSYFKDGSFTGMHG